MDRPATLVTSDDLDIGVDGIGKHDATVAKQVALASAEPATLGA